MQSFENPNSVLSGIEMQKRASYSNGKTHTLTYTEENAHWLASKLEDWFALVGIT